MKKVEKENGQTGEALGPGKGRIERLIRCIGVAMFTEKAVRIRMDGGHPAKEIVGRIDKIATASSMLKIGLEDAHEWIRLDDVLDMELES